MIEKEEDIKKSVKKIIEEVTIRNNQRSDSNRDEVFGNITSRIAQSEKLSKNRLRTAVCSAAAVVICALVYSIYVNQTQTIIHEINYTEIAQAVKSESKEVTISLNNSTAIEIKNNANIEHTATGEITIDNRTIDNTPTESIEPQISQVIVPKSKRAEVLLSDGTKVTLNSDSRIIYATCFDSNIREVYIEGEAFLDVAKDSGKPFIVKTKKFTVNVTGTKFNVTSYDNDNTSRVVLVEGKVDIDVVNKPKMHLDPGQMAQIDNQHSKIENVDTYKYTCWMDKLMIFENQSLKDVADRVSRFYNIDLIIEPKYAGMIINGKLDLKDNAEDVVKTLSLISKLKITQISNSTVLTN